MRRGIWGGDVPLIPGFLPAAGIVHAVAAGTTENENFAAGCPFPLRGKVRMGVITLIRRQAQDRLLIFSPCERGGYQNGMFVPMTLVIFTWTEL